jgi:hypothetical protein
MTEKELQAIRARAEKATTGKTPEWYVDDEYENIVVREAWDCKLIAQGIPSKADADFIAAARQDVPELLAEVERLKEQFAHISDMAAELYEVDTVKNEWILRKNLEPHADFIDEIFIVSSEEAGLVDNE